MTNVHSILKSRDITLPRKICLVKAMVFSVVVYGCESWTIKKAEYWRITAFELWCWRTLESPLDCKEIQPVHPKGDQSWVLIGRTDAEAETPILWPPNVKNWLMEKTLMLGKIEGRRRRDNRGWDVGWHHWLDGHEFEKAPGVGDERGNVAYCSQRGRKESDTTERLNWTEQKAVEHIIKWAGLRVRLNWILEQTLNKYICGFGPIILILWNFNSPISKMWLKIKKWFIQLYRLL